MKLWIFITALIFCSLSSLSQEMETHLVTIEEIGGQLKIWVPSTLERPISDSSEERKLLLGEYKNKKVILRFRTYLPTQFNDTILTDNAVPALTDDLLKKLRNDKNFSYIDDGIFLQDGKNIGYVKGKLRHGNGDLYYQLIFFTTLGNKLVEFNFSCPWKIARKWKKPADTMANSIKIISAE